MSIAIGTAPVSASLNALALAAGAPPAGVTGPVIAFAAILGLAVIWLVRRNLAARARLERELELLLPGTRAGGWDSAASGLPMTTGSTANPSLREQAREWIARDPERAALLLAAWAGETEKPEPGARNAA